MYDSDTDAKVKADPGMYEELSLFLKRTQERLEREVSDADQAEAHAKMARHRAEQTRRVYETLAKQHESMANVPADSPTIDPAKVNIAGYGKGWR